MSAAIEVRVSRFRTKEKLDAVNRIQRRTTASGHVPKREGLQ
jgi:hypothetical protein